jgi:uncharacterized membrane protein YphA (DoxX/SURF4 family)
MAARPFEGIGPQRQLNTIDVGYILQRLFSTFPSGWPGVGLLLLRLCLAIALLYFSIPRLSDPSEAIVFAQRLIAAAGGIFLLAGLWTPVTGTLVALDEAWIAFSVYSQGRENAWIHMFLAVLAVSVAMLGPGVWSIDARLFGRQRFVIDPIRGRNSSL